MKIINVAAAIIYKNNKILIAQRGYGEFKGMYEFPGGKLEEDESGEEAVVREIKEELSADIKVEKFFYHAHYVYPNFILEMDCYLCSLLNDHFEVLEHQDVRWISPDDENIHWIPADIQIINEIISKGLI